MPTTPGLSPLHLRLFVIGPTLARLAGPDAPGIDSPAAVELLMGTAAQESGFRALDQFTGKGDRTLGPAYGLFQMEPATLDDLYDTFLAYRPALRERFERLRAPDPDRTTQLATNLAFACAAARLRYYRSPVRLAAAGDVEGHARVWKEVYNTRLGKGRPEEFVANFRALVAPHL